MFGRRLAVLILVALAVGTPLGWAQESASSGIVGQVTDSTRGALPGATVTVTNTGTNAQRSAVTDTEGRFTIPNLPPATYTIRVELSGFQAAELKDVTLRNGEIARPNVVLGLANVQSFTRGTQFGAAGSSRSQYVTVEGGRDSSTNYAIDGVYVRSLRFNNLSLNPPLDAVQEVNILRNAFTTEYGQGQAVVSIVTKSGTNNLTRRSSSAATKASAPHKDERCWRAWRTPISSPATSRVRRRRSAIRSPVSHFRGT
jgi:hypothetical protein